MKIINATTKKGGYLIRQYNNTVATTLTDCYKKPSKNKIRAFANCVFICCMEKGKNFKIISANYFTFAVAWQVPEGLRVKTYYGSYLVKF